MVSKIRSKLLAHSLLQQKHSSLDVILSIGSVKDLAPLFPMFESQPLPDLIIVLGVPPL